MPEGDTVFQAARMRRDALGDAARLGDQLGLVRIEFPAGRDRMPQGLTGPTERGRFERLGRGFGHTTESHGKTKIRDGSHGHGA